MRLIKDNDTSMTEAGAKSIIIIGAGIAGLATGVYAQMSGYRTHILEMHNKPGGACTAWKRKGYTFDYCIHNLAGTGEYSATHHLWEELGALRDTTIIDEEEFVSVEDSQGKKLNLYSNADRLEEHLRTLAPADEAAIEKFVNLVRKFKRFDMSSMIEGGMSSTLSSLRYMRDIMKWSKVSMAEYADEFTDPFLRKAFPLLHYSIPSVPVFANASTLAALGRGDMGRPTGGSLEFARNIEKRYQEIGGLVTYGAKVTEVVVENGSAVGVRLEDGTEHRADMVVSAADGYATIYGMLNGRYTDPLIESYYHEWVPESEPFALEVFIGAYLDLSGEKHAVVLLLDQPVTIAGSEVQHLALELFDHHTGFAPEGKGVIKVVFDSSNGHWKQAKERGSYQEEKDAVSSQVIELLSKRFPDLRSKVEAVDVVTPLTAERYTGTYRGYQCWPAKESYMKIMRKGLSRTLPGLKNFHMVGQWASASTGVSTAAIEARKLVKELCKHDDRRFVIEP
jgi:phytoene dehydrogenase-like protein